VRPPDPRLRRRVSPRLERNAQLDQPRSAICRAARRSALAMSRYWSSSRRDAAT
jgi:hypothetical protein